MSEDQVTMIRIEDLAKRWGCSKNFIRRRCKSGEVPATKIGGLWFIPMRWTVQQERKLEPEGVSMVECEECGRHGPLDEIGTCGDWIGSPGDGYACPDILCPDSRGETEGGKN